jgi:uncharacterized damage-inducible protein DinB
MTKLLEPMTKELQQETAITRRVLERVPADKLSWKPHPKSMSLGQLSLHIAMIPGILSKLSQLEEFDASTGNFDPPAPKTTEEILAALDASVQAVQQNLDGFSDSTVMGDWRLTVRGKEMFTVTRMEMLRSIMLNHWYHHRGQLSVYLRLLDVPVPVIYGRSADENPFA